MLIALIEISAALLAVMTFASIRFWNLATVEQRTKLFFATTAFRLLLLALIFGGSAYILRSDIENIKIFTLIFALMYFLSLIFDTGYFYYTSNKK